MKVRKILNSKRSKSSPVIFFISFLSFLLLIFGGASYNDTAKFLNYLATNFEDVENLSSDGNSLAEVKGEKTINSDELNSQSEVDNSKESGELDGSSSYPDSKNRSQQENEGNLQQYYTVSEVVDGDTIKIKDIGTIRLIGINTPEVKDLRRPVECFGQEASQKAKELLFNKNVRLEYDNSQGEKDKYGRILAYVYREDGLFFNHEMIKTGYAYEYTYNTPYFYQELFRTAEEYARINSLGLWSPKTCNGKKETKTSEAPSTPYNSNTQTKSEDILGISDETYSTNNAGDSSQQNSGNYTDESLYPTQIPLLDKNSSQFGIYACNCSKTCTAISSCEEAYYQLVNCGCSKRDGDLDGVPCESLCK